MRLDMRRSIVSIAAVAAIAATAVPADAATKSIKVADNYYVRSGPAPTVTVKRNDRVVWNFVGRSAHTVHSTDRRMAFQSRPMTSGRFSKTMRKVGTFKIFCDIHGSSK